MTTGATTGNGREPVSSHPRWVARIANMGLGLLLALSVGPLGSIMARLLDPTPGTLAAVGIFVSLFVLSSLPSDGVYGWLRGVDGILFVLSIALSARTAVAISDGLLQAQQGVVAMIVVVLLAGLSALGAVASNSAATSVMK